MYLHNGYWASLVGSQAVLWVAITFERLICSQWNYDAGGPDKYQSTSMRKKDDAIADHGHEQLLPANTYFAWAIDLLFNSRGIGHPWQLKTTPPAYRPDETKSNFLFWRLVSCVISFALTLGAAYQPEPPAHLLTARHVYSLRRIDEMNLEEVIFKFLSALGFLVGIYTTVCWMANVFILFVVSTSMYDFRTCRSNFGSPLEAFTIRRFWSKLWHQYLRSTLEGIADWTVDHLPTLKSHRIAARYSRILIAFLISGIVHVGCDVGARIPLSESGAVSFFCSQALGIMIEDAVQEAYHRLFGSAKGNSPQRWVRVVGYLWVSVYMSCTLPLWSFPYLRRHEPGGSPIVPSQWIGLA